MGFYRGPNATTVTEGLINSITLYNMVGYTSSDVNGSFQYYGYKTGEGCASSSVWIELKDSIPWNRISCRFILNGNAACWSFNQVGVWNGGLGPGSGYCYSYDPAQGDVFTEERSLNSWGKPQFQSHNRMGACDNDSNNFYHGSFQTGNPKMFLMRRRRDNSGNLAGIHHSSACQSSGPGHTVIIKDIKIWFE